MDLFLEYQLTKAQQRQILGGASSSATCTNGTTVNCTGGQHCYSLDPNENSSGYCKCTDSKGVVVDSHDCPIP